MVGSQRVVEFDHYEPPGLLGKMLRKSAPPRSDFQHGLAGPDICRLNYSVDDIPVNQKVLAK
jgi:hypothetical protein